METLTVQYEITARDVKRAARLVAREQSLGVKETLYETRNVKRREAAVREITLNHRTAHVEIELPSGQIDSAYGLFLSIAGEISCLGAMTSIRLVDFDVPDRLAKRLGGPRWGGEGFYKLLQVHKRPIFVSVIKPSQGLTPKEFADLAFECLRGGIDIVKSDELLQEPREEFLHRVRASVQAARRAEEETGEKKLFMVHVVAPAGEIPSLYEEAVFEGAGIAMFAPAAMGFPPFHALASLGRVPVMAHMATSGWLWQRHGMSVRSWAKFLRLFGADIILYPALRGTLRSSLLDVESLKQVCEMSWHGLMRPLPAVGGGQHAATLAVHHRIFGPEFVFLCGGGVCGHPQGARAGARSIRQAWEAIEQGVPARQYARKAPELARALTAFAKYV